MLKLCRKISPLELRYSAKCVYVCEREKERNRETERRKDKKERQKMASAGVVGEEVGTK